MLTPEQLFYLVDNLEGDNYIVAITGSACLRRIEIVRPMWKEFDLENIRIDL